MPNSDKGDFMKKFLTIIAVVLVIVCLAGVLAACGSTKGLSFKRAKISINHTAPATFTSSNVTEVTALAGKTVQNQSGTLVVLSKQNNEDVTVRTLYNAETDTVLVTDTTDQFRLYTKDSNSYYLRYKLNAVSGLYETTLYNSKGEEVKFVNASGEEQSVYASAEIPMVSSVSEDVVTFADNYFRVPRKGNTVDRIGRQFGLVEFEYDFDMENDKYYYQFNEANGRAYVFDKKLKLVTTYFAHGDYDNIRFFVLENGDLVVQTVTELMDEAKDYTYINDGKKYLLKTSVVDAKTGKVTNKKFKYLIQILVDVPVLSAEMNIKLNAKNIAVLYPIEDEQLLNSNNDAMAVSISNGLRVQGRLDKMIDNQLPGTFFELLNGYLTVETPLGAKLVTTSGKVIGDFAYEDYNEELFTLNGKIYDFNLKALFDYEAEGYTLSSWMKYSVILSKIVDGNLTYFRFDSSMTAPKAISSTTATFSRLNAYLYSLRTDGVYTYYNEKDEVVTGLPVSAALNSVLSNSEKECYLFVATVEGERHYYRISK